MRHLAELCFACIAKTSKPIEVVNAGCRNL